MSQDPIYKNSDSLIPIYKLAEEVDAALSDKERVMSNDADINAALAAAGGVTAGGAVGFAALYFAGVTGLSAAGITSALAAAGGLIGGGMAAGVAVLAAPAVLLGVGAYAWAAKASKGKLIENKKILLAEISRRHSLVVVELQAEMASSHERADYLKKVNVLLEAAIKDLESDLKIHRKNA